jgi:hypothetical protein
MSGVGGAQLATSPVFSPPGSWRSLDRQVQFNALLTSTGLIHPMEWLTVMSPQQPQSLRISKAAFERLRDGLRASNQWNDGFDQQYARLERVLRTAVKRLCEVYGDRLEQIILASDELIGGVDLGELSYYGTALYIVLHTDAVSDEDYDRIIDRVFISLDASMLRLQVHLLTTAQWDQLQRDAIKVGRLEERALALLNRG